ncbi:MAG: Zn-dependent hydrolase [Betaproteobacteria bacterium HGW-Betaproteobacteria-11]|nr:MAG: Zn-dependent hydrolase [Betaproteobacteria bacterium HGW-Betaproteobacteria-11]
MPLPFALDHINLWLLADDDAYTAVDTGYASAAVRAAWTMLLAEHPLRRIIVTHFHPDHLGLAAWLSEETGAPLWMSQGEYLTGKMVHAGIAPYSVTAMVEFFRRHGLDAARAAALEARGNAYRHGVPEIPEGYRQLFAGERLRIGHHEWRTLVGHGHAPEHMSLYCEALGVLVAGDMLLPRISTNIAVPAANPDGDPLRLFLASLDDLRALPADTLVLPSHGRPFRGLHARIAQLEAHHAERCEVALAACAQRPYSAAELIPLLFGRDFSDPHQTMFAMGEAIAHLNFLFHAGKLRRVDHDRFIRFSR